MKSIQVMAWVSILTAAALVIAISGCGNAKGKVLGTTIPKEEPAVSLSDILDNPTKYDGKSFVMKGTLSGQCAALCDFTFRDGNRTATIYPQGFKPPKISIGQKVTVYAQATVGPEKVVLSAIGMALD